MTKPTSNLTNSNVSILSNSNEKYSKIKNEIRQQAIADVLNFDKRDLTDINNTIKEINDLKEGNLSYIQINSNGKKVNYKELQQYKNFGAIFNKYKGKDDEKEKMYMEIAERIILDRWWIVEYKDWTEIWKEQITEDFVRKEYNLLNEEYKYKDRLDFFTIKDRNWRLYIIKWKNDELKKIKEKEEELKYKKIEELQKSSEADTKKTELEDLDSELNNEKTEEVKNEESKRMEALIRNLMEDSEEKDRRNEARFAELEKLLKNKDKKTNKKSEDTDENIIDEEDNKNDNKLEDSEALDEKQNYISRSFVEGLIVGIRKSKGYPKWTIRIREEVINVEEFEFYEEFKQEYIEAKWDATRLSRLDKEFAEMIILFSPKWADYNNKYCIKLSESELKDGLYVSDERLARYGVRINVTKYEHEVIEKEIIRERKIVEKIETTITELQTSIVELTRTISIEKSLSTVILEEIKRKRELLAILIKKQKILLASLKWLDNDEDLKRLREEEARLQKEYDNLLKEKEKQNKLNEEIDKIKKKIAEWEKNHGEENHEKEKIRNEILEKENTIKGIEDEIKKLEGRKSFVESQLSLKNWALTIDRKHGYEKELKEIDEKIAWYKSDIEKLNQDIQDLKDKLEWDDEIAKLEKEITNKKTEKIKLQKRLSKLVAEKSLYETSRTNDETYADNERRNAEIEEIEKKLKIINKEIEELETKKEELENWGKDSEELKKLIKRLAELEGQLDPDIDEKLEEKEQELENIKKQIEEKEQSWDKWELEAQLIAIIEEQKNLLAELESLEALLTTAKTKEEKIKIEEEIRIINERLTIISQKITEFESFIQIYKSRETITKYKIFQIIPIDPIPVPNKPFEMTSAISDMGTDVFKEKAALKVEEELKRQYDWLGRWQMWSRLALFLWRWSKRKKMMKNEMNNMANTAFQTNAAYATLNDQSQNAADRHAHELLTNMAAVNRITTVHNPQVDQLCKDYLNGRETDSTFQTKFNAIVAADANIQNALNGQNITHIWTNILLQLKEHLALKDLIDRLDSELDSYIHWGHNPMHIQNMQNFVEQYIKDYQKLPAFKTTFEQFLQWNLNARNKLRRYLSHQKAIMNMQITNLRMNIDILNRWKSAYQIDNKDREKGWKYKVWHFMDKHPRGTAIWTVALSVWLWVATAPLSAVAWAAVTTWVFGSYVWFTNYIKKWTHHTKEQNTHEKNVVTDYRNEQAKIQNWQNLALNGHGRKKYKAKRQLALYDQTTQANIQLSNQISEYITNLSSKTWDLTPDEDNFMRLNLIEWWARLKYYRAMWHNFLASEKVDETEKDMRKLEKSITLWLQKIGKTTNDIETTMTATNGLGTNITYNVIQNDLKTSYDKSLIQFKRERRWLALRYGIWTAALSIGTALGMQYLMWTWVFAKWKIECPDAELTAVKDNFALWKAELLDGSNSVYLDSNTAFSSISENGTKLNLWYWAWTDGTHVIPWRLTLSDLIWWSGKVWKIPDVKGNIDALVWSNGFTQAHANVFKDALDHLPTGVWTNGVLQNMRQAEWIEQWAKALVSSGKSSMINPSDITIAYDPSLDVIWTTNHTLADRVFNWIIEIAWPCKETEAPKRWRRLMWVPLFFNTFKKRKPTKDTTDQNFWQWNNQQRPHQPQPNQNQPHNP